MLRYKEDWRTVMYMIITTGLLIVQWNLESFNPILWVACMFFAVSVSVMAHNHNHLRVWTNPVMNRFHDYWLTVFYGFPVFGWIPTHNKNHHKFTNREGDFTITYRISEGNNLFTLLTYPTISSYYQQKPISSYLKMLWSKRRSEFFWCMSQYAVLIAWIVGFLILDWKKALLYIVIPQQFALFSVLIFNYLQHVHADEEDEWNHSRNIVGPLMNIMLFNNGYHTVHHNQPGLHWSKTPAAHAEVAHNIDPSLNEQSFWWLLIRTYILGSIIPKFRSHSMRLDRMNKQSAVEA
ncbi:MAG: fatty acid desaturase [bacterium]